MKKKILIGVGAGLLCISTGYLGYRVYKIYKQEKENLDNDITPDQFEELLGEIPEVPKPQLPYGMSPNEYHDKLKSGLLDTIADSGPYADILNDQLRTEHPTVDYQFNDETNENELYINNIHWRNFVNDTYDGLDIRVMKTNNDIIFSPSIIAMIEVLIWNDPFVGMERTRLKMESDGEISGMATSIVSDIPSGDNNIYEQEEITTNIFEKEEEEKVLKHEKNSDEAYFQYKNMRLRDLTDDIKKMLDPYWGYSVPMENSTELEDDNTKQTVLKKRKEFFGDDSIWANGISYAEILLEFAEMAEWNFQEGINYYVGDFCDNLDMQTRGDIETAIQVLSTHSFLNNDNMSINGMFGLDDEDLNQARIKFGPGKLSWWKQYQIWMENYYESE